MNIIIKITIKNVMFTDRWVILAHNLLQSVQVWRKKANMTEHASNNVHTFHIFETDPPKEPKIRQKLVKNANS